MSRVHGFPPIADRRASLLILGSMPGRQSLEVGQYYAHPRNAFWPIIDCVFGIDRHLPYEARCRGLRTQRIALWDVLKTCNRPGSLDASIEPSSIVANDFVTFFAEHPGIRAVYFNGQMAEQAFRRHVLPDAGSSLPTLRLPSTSPANASYSFERKLAAWRVISGPD